jgi:hypothetical protein
VAIGFHGMLWTKVLKRLASMLHKRLMQTPKQGLEQG